MNLKMNNKGVSKTVIIAVIVAVIAAGAGTYFAIRPRPPAGKKPGEIWIAIVTDVGGRGDLSFNDMGFRGCDLAKEKGIVDKVTEVVSTTAEDYEPNLRMLAKSGNYDLIIPIGFMLTKATYKVAKEYPQQNFACIDFVPSWEELPLTPATLGVIFREEQSGALLGVLSGLISAAYEKPHVSIVLGMEIPPVIAYEMGFRYGLYWAIGPDGWYENRFGKVAPEIGKAERKIIYDYTGRFDDPALGKSTAEAQLEHDLSICWGAAGATGLGVFDAVEEYHNVHGILKGEPPFILGVDADQDWMKPGLVLASGMKRIDQAVLYLCKQVREEKFKDIVKETNGILTLGIGKGATGISNLEMLDVFIEFGIVYEKRTGEKKLPATPDEIRTAVREMRDAQPEWVWEGVSEFEKKMKMGEIKVPRILSKEKADPLRKTWA